MESIDQQIVILQKSEFVADKDSGIGGGLRKFILEAKNQGETTLVFKLWREWEGESSVKRRYHVTLKIR
ncbi:MAG: hypothetical protein E3K32_11580 [wastewater metagenome]|nr:hypothetical protein [Candidatus Loosdrechtia aerotolerans]